MTQAWAVVAADGSFVVRYTSDQSVHPRNAGHAAECNGCSVFPLAREPDRAHGEGVDPKTGAINFKPERIALAANAAIKATAQAAILSVAPLWKQINDIHEPAAQGAIARRAEINRIREWSNGAERRLLAAKSTDEIKAILAERP